MKKSILNRALLSMLFVLGACSTNLDPNRNLNGTTNPFIEQAKGVYTYEGKTLELKADGHIYEGAIKVYNYEDRKSDTQAIYSVEITRAKGYIGIAYVNKKMQFYRDKSSDSPKPWDNINGVNFDPESKDGESTEKVPPTDPDGGDLDTIIDEATKDALTKLGPVTGMIQWEFKFYGSDNGFSQHVVCNLFISSDKYKQTMVTVYDGNVQGTEADNEVVLKTALEGELAIENTFKLVNSDGDEINDKKGYTKLHIQTYDKFFIWSYFETASKWEKSDYQSEVEYWIVKESSTELSMIEVSPSGDGYLLYDSSIDDARANIYTKK